MRDLARVGMVQRGKLTAQRGTRRKSRDGDLAGLRLAKLLCCTSLYEAATGILP